MDAAGLFFSLYLLVNLARTRRDAEVVHYRLSRACRRLLGINIRRCDLLGRDTIVLLLRKKGWEK
jgi:hypothetical protein